MSDSVRIVFLGGLGEIGRNCCCIEVDGRILLVEFAVPSANQASLGKDADMIMLGFPGGMERTEDEYRSLFAQSGFQLSKVTPTRCAVSVYEGRPA